MAEKTIAAFNFLREKKSGDSTMIQYDGYNDLIEKVYSEGQEHLFGEWDNLSDEEKKNLLDELKGVDFSLMKSLFEHAGDVHEEKKFSPAPYIGRPQSESEKKEYAKARAAGIEFIKSGKAAAFIVAGGQGSRLGYDGPKGKFPVGPVSNKTLFQVHGEKIVKYSRKYDVSVPWLVMTSEANHEETEKYFKEMNYFGLAPDDVYIFRQNMIPSLDDEGKMVLQGPESLFRNPDGHGGSLTALSTSGVLQKMKERGIEIISYFQVDNPLVKIIDPVFIGFHVLRGADISSKALKKAYPGEKVGVFVERDDGRIGVVEYSDLPDEKAEERDSNGELRYSAGSIAIHLFSRNFIEKITGGGDLSLPFHTARKKLKVYKEGGMQEVNGYKFEKFVFDALPLTGHNVVFETVREEEFAPVKNATGVDSVETSRELMMNLHRRWLEERGIAVPASVEKLEISPLVAVEPEDIDADIDVPDHKEVYLL